MLVGVTVKSTYPMVGEPVELGTVVSVSNNNRLVFRGSTEAVVTPVFDPKPTTVTAALAADAAASAVAPASAIRTLRITKYSRFEWTRTEAKLSVNDSVPMAVNFFQQRRFLPSPNCDELRI